METLIPMVKFVLEQKETQAGADLNEADYYYQEWCKLQQIRSYAKFLSRPLELGMFVPCDENGNVLEEPKNYKEWLKKSLNTPYDADLSKYEKYQQAKQRVLFDGFEIFEYPDAEDFEITKVIRYKRCYAAHFLDNEWRLGVGLRTIEALLESGNIKLTPTAITHKK